MKIAIFETGSPDEELIERFGTYATMFQKWLDPVFPEADFTALAIHAGATLPQPDDFDGYLITGSRHGAYDPLPWIAPLSDFLCQLRDLRIPVGGICFGHQIMAQAYGGHVEKSAHGWILGAQSYHERSIKTALAFHQDQVITPPPGVKYSTGNDACPFGRFEYQHPALSVQYHPEFSSAYVEALLDKYAGTRIPMDAAQKAKRSLHTPLESTKLAQDFAQFFKDIKRVEGRQ